MHGHLPRFGGCLGLALPFAGLARADDGLGGRRVVTEFGTALTVGDAVDDAARRRVDAGRVERRLARGDRGEKACGDLLWLEAEINTVAGWA